MSMEKYGLEWWETLHDACRALGKLESLEALDALTADVFPNPDSLDAVHTAFQWFNTGNLERTA